jgi:two-component system sensor histidine kinase EvgS
MTAGAIPLRRSPTKLGDVLRLIGDVMTPQAKAVVVTLSVVIDDELPLTVDVDGHKVAWIVSTLIGNALRYVRHGTSRMPGGLITVRAGLSARTREVIVEVQDDGRGMPAALARRLTAGLASDAPYGALALEMVRDVATAHGGRFEIESQTDPVGHGTTIRFTLPAASPAPASAATGSTSTPVASPASSG